MRRRLLFLTALLLLTMLPTSMPSAHAQSGRPVLTFLYTWYEKSTWDDPDVGDQPVDRYGSGDRDTMRRQIQQLDDVGINCAILPWYGNTSKEDPGQLTTRLKQFMDVIEETGSKVKVAILLEQGPDGGAALREPAGMIAALKYAEANLFNRPSYMKIDGKPLVVFYHMPGVGSVETFQNIRNATDPNRNWFWLSEGIDFSYLKVADAQYFYSIADFQPAVSLKNYRDLLEQFEKANSVNKPFVGTVMPGYDDRLAYKDQGKVTDREDGNYYRKSWKAVIDNNADMVVITSWNEYVEGHNIEPSKKYGDQYLTLTKELLPTYKNASSAAPASPAPQPSGAFADSAFETVWQRADKAVAEQRAGRSWTWGPQPATEGLQEPFNSGTRLVQYFDKSRMEINDPSGDRSSPWFVTNGLLVKEMISGQLQTGNESFEKREPAAQPLAGDPASANGDAPTYASLASVIAQRAADRTGQVVKEKLNKDGSTATIEPPGQVRYSSYVNETSHNIPTVFWNYMNSSGPVYEGGRYRDGQVVDWLFAFGYPIGDAYWIVAKVGGVDTNVLVQPFERRILTYVPTNPAAYQVEMGNVGQHYYKWRYNK